MDIRQGPHQVAQKSSNTGWPRKDSRRTVLPERSFSSKFGAATTSLRRLLEQAATNRMASPRDARARPGRGLANQERIQALLNLGFGVHADQLINDFSAFEEEECRDGGDTVARGHLRV